MIWSATNRGRFCSFGLAFTLFLLLAGPARGQAAESSRAAQSASAQPVLEAIDRAAGCCETPIDMADLRVFADGKIEWDEMTATPFGKLEFVHKTSVATKKELKAVRWAVASMSGLSPSYVAAAAQGNIDNDDWIEITGRDAKRIRKVIVGFGNSIDEENYTDAPPALKTVVCTIAIIRQSRAHEPAPDTAWCRKYYVGY